MTSVFFSPNTRLPTRYENLLSRNGNRQLYLVFSDGIIIKYSIESSAFEIIYLARGERYNGNQSAFRILKTFKSLCECPEMTISEQEVQILETNGTLKAPEKKDLIRLATFISILHYFFSQPDRLTIS